MHLNDSYTQTAILTRLCAKILKMLLAEVSSKALLGLPCKSTNRSTEKREEGERETERQREKRKERGYDEDAAGRK